ncbi:MAG: GspH/FimT family protein [Pseudohongiellaceae bacterium]
MNHTRGFSLLELLISLGLLSVLLSISLADFMNLAQSVSADATLRKLANAIQAGKSSAITNRTSVTVCPSIDGFKCGGGWHRGVIVFTDNNRNTKVDTEDLLIRHVSFPNANGSIRFRAFQNKQYLQLTSMGTTHSQNGNFTYCPFAGDVSLARQLIVNRSARMRFALDNNGDGIREDSRGRALVC